MREVQSLQIGQCIISELDQVVSVKVQGSQAAQGASSEGLQSILSEIECFEGREIRLEPFQFACREIYTLQLRKRIVLKVLEQYVGNHLQSHQLWQTQIPELLNVVIREVETLQLGSLDAKMLDPSVGHVQCLQG